MTERSKYILAKILSGVFHPLLMPVYLSIAMVTLLSSTPEMYPRAQWQIIYVCTYSFVLLPVGILYILKKLGKLNSIHLNEQKERFFPMVLIAISYIVGIRLLHRIDAPATLIMLMRGVCLAIMLVAMISILWKISAHMTGMGGALGITLVLSIIYRVDLSSIACLISLIAGLVGWARLYLNHHTIKQVNYGFLLGFNTMIVSFFLHAWL